MMTANWLNAIWNSADSLSSVVTKANWGIAATLLLGCFFTAIAIITGSRKDDLLKASDLERGEKIAQLEVTAEQAKQKQREVELAIEQSKTHQKQLEANIAQSGVQQEELRKQIWNSNLRLRRSD
jgi:septal ring factor EnvC (AmiA/AmiB activator)